MPITIIFVLLELGTMRLILHHCVRLLELSWKNFSTFFISVEAVDIVASSAKSEIFCNAKITNFSVLFH